jgi:hypothetical protein
MKEIPLTQGKVALVDDDDYDRLMAIGKWYFGCGGYAVRSVGYKKPNGRWSCKIIYMHCIIMNTPSGMDTDHSDTDKLNNQKYNLRICTRSQNKMNIRITLANSSGYKGVCWFKRGQKWKAQIMVNGKNIHLGYFTCPIEAAKVYNEAAIKYHGEFARLNDV